MHVASARPIRRTATLVALAAVVLLAAAIVPVSGVFPAAAGGVLTAFIALSLSVRDALIATAVQSALVVIAIGASSTVMFSVAFMVAIAFGAAAAIRVGRGTVALVVAAQLSLVVSASTELGMPHSAFGVGGVILASGLLICAGAIFVVRWVPEAVTLAPRIEVVAHLAVIVPITALATWATVAVLDSTRGWALAALLVAAAVGVMPGRSMARLLAVISGAFLAAIVVTVSAGVPVLIALVVVLGVGISAATGRSLSLAVALPAAVLLVGASSIAATDVTQPDPLLAAVSGAFVAWAALGGVAWLISRKPQLADVGAR